MRSTVAAADAIAGPALRKAIVGLGVPLALLTLGPTTAKAASGTMIRPAIGCFTLETFHEMTNAANSGDEVSLIHLYLSKKCVQLEPGTVVSFLDEDGAALKVRAYTDETGGLSGGMVLWTINSPEYFERR